MGFILADIVDESRELDVNSWNWGPTVELIKQTGILDMPRSEAIRYNQGAEFSADEAKRIGAFLRDKILTRLQPSERITLDLDVTDEPDDGTFHRGDLAKNYGAQYDWLKQFSEFCLASNGFKVH